MADSVDGDSNTTTWPTVTSIDEISGWFSSVDQAVFRHALTWQQHQPEGTVVEMGCFMGKSAVLIGEYVREQERFVVIDLFGRTDLLEDASEGNQHEVSGSSYQWTLTQNAFEHNYRCLHGDLPEVVAGLSTRVLDLVDPHSARFCHIDASHDYETVKIDIANVAGLVRPGGVVVLDDYRTEHTPGVAAAAWGAVRDGVVIPVVLTGSKMYGVFSEPDAFRDAMVTALRADPRYVLGVDVIDGHSVYRVHPRLAPEAARAAAIKARGETVPERMAREAADGATAASTATAQRQVQARRAQALRDSHRPVRRLRRAALAVLPPVLSSALRKAKHAVADRPHG